MLTAAVALAALSMPGAKATLDMHGRPLPGNVQFYEVFMNPPGSGDDNSGREYIVLRGPANMSLDTYAIVALENEHGSGGTNDIGSCDMIIPLDGKTLDGNGLLVIRDKDGSNALHVFDPADTSGNEWAFQWQTTNQDAAAGDEWGYTYSGNTRTGAAPVDPHDGGVNGGFGGNTLENEGTNLFIVQYVNKDLRQEIDGVSKGTQLDSDHDGVLDFTEVSPPMGYMCPWTNCSDSIMIPLKDKAFGTNSSTQQLDYTGQVSATTHISVARHSNSTPDMFWRLTDSYAYVSDILTGSGNKLGVDASEDYFSDDPIATSHVLGVTPPNPANILVEIGNTGYFTIKHDTTLVQYTH